MELEQMQELMQALSDFFTLTPHTDTLIKLDILQDIIMDQAGTVLPAGLYFIDYDSAIYTPEVKDSPLPFTLTALHPVQTAQGAHMKIANVIFYIGEYMRMPKAANALLDNIFPQNPLTAALQNIVLPDTITQPIDRLTQTFFANKLLPGTEITLNSGVIPASKDGRREETTLAPIVTVSLLDLPPGIVLSRTIAPVDNEVFTAICSLLEAGNKRFTGQDIYRVMTGNPNALASPEKLQEIDESWTRLTSTAMTLDTGNMGDAYHFARWVRNRRIVEGGKDTIIIQNQHGRFETTLYSVNEEPTLKTYSDSLGQIQRYPLEIRNTPVNKTMEIIVLQNALLQHIHAIPAISNHIVYENLFSRINLDALSAEAGRKKRAKLRNQIHKMLEHWKSSGLIRGWTEEKRNGTIYCIVIDKPTAAALPAAPEEKPLKKRGRPPKKTGTLAPFKNARIALCINGFQHHGKIQ